MGETIRRKLLLLHGSEVGELTGEDERRGGAHEAEEGGDLVAVEHGGRGRHCCGLIASFGAGGDRRDDDDDDDERRRGQAEAEEFI